MNYLELWEQNYGSTEQETANENIESEKTAEEQEYSEDTEERMEVLKKYAEAADKALQEEYGNEYTEDDVVKVAQAMIEQDYEQEQAMNKVAEADQMGRIMAKSFKDELAKSEE